MSYYQRHIFFCTNQREGERPCCQQHNSQAMRDYAKQRCKELGIAGPGGVRVNSAGCLDRCESGPVIVIYPEGVWYTYVDSEDVDEIIDSHIREGKRVKRLEI